jgi:hypothetical protein
MTILQKPITDKEQLLEALKKADIERIKIYEDVKTKLHPT